MQQIVFSKNGHPSVHPIPYTLLTVWLILLTPRHVGLYVPPLWIWVESGDCPTSGAAGEVVLRDFWDWSYRELFCPCHAYSWNLLPCFDEAQTAWRGHTWAFQPMVPARPSANKPALTTRHVNEWASDSFSLWPLSLSKSLLLSSHTWGSDMMKQRQAIPQALPEFLAHINHEIQYKVIVVLIH